MSERIRLYDALHHDHRISKSIDSHAYLSPGNGATAYANSKSVERSRGGMDTRSYVWNSVWVSVATTVGYPRQKLF